MNRNIIHTEVYVKRSLRIWNSQPMDVEIPCLHAGGRVVRRSFTFHELGDEEFEDLISQICSKILGTGTVVFATGPDGGRDGTFHGCAQSFPSTNSPLTGKFVIQAKHTSNPTASCSDRSFSKIVDSEKSKLTKLLRNGELDHYLLFTNRKKPADKSIAKEKELKKLGSKTAHIFGTEQLRTWLTSHSTIWSDLGFDRFEKKKSSTSSQMT